jgi:hypothetical protein
MVGARGWKSNHPTLFLTCGSDMRRMAQHWNLTLKRLGAISLLFVAVLGGAFFCVSCGSKPPIESTLIESFRAHRAAYEHLRDMLEADQQLLRVASWGVETTNSGISHPPEGGFPIGRYNEYLALLRETGAIGADRGRGAHPESVSVLVWASGWGEIRGTSKFVGWSARLRTRFPVLTIAIAPQNRGVRFSGTSMAIGICGQIGKGCRIVTRSSP